MDKRDKTGSLLALGAFAAITLGAGLYASRYSPTDIRKRAWYASLDKPGYTPPDKVFPIVWTCLYVLIAISGWRVWRSEPSWRRRQALKLWAEQLIINAEWSKIFFDDHRIGLALMDTIALERTILRYIRTTYPFDKPAAMLFVPYAGWVGFATMLNADIARRNLGGLRHALKLA